MNNIVKRRRKERLFICAALVSIVIAVFFLAGLLTSVAWQGWRGLLSSSLSLEIHFDPTTIGLQGEESALAYHTIVKRALRERFPAVSERAEKKQLSALISFGAALRLKEAVNANPSLVGLRQRFWLPAAAKAEAYLKGAVDSAVPESQRRISDRQVAWLVELKSADQTQLSFNRRFFTNADSRDPELAGIKAALIGSALSLLVAFLVSFPIAVFAALYLEMFAPRNRWFDFIEININNLAAVPSIIFGVLGLAIFINFFGLPRSSPLVGGLVLSMMTLPTIIIASRAALAAVPPSMLSAALSLGATRMQGVWHHVLPSAMPGVLTGAIIGMARALGETAPLLVIGMVAFIAEAPAGFADSATALPAQVFLWANSPERGFAERTAAAIITLMVFLIVMNGAAVYLRKKWEFKW